MLIFIVNIFATSKSPFESAIVLPDKLVVKMPVETCQMISIIYSKWYYDWGNVHKTDGTPYETKKGAFRNHPCTQWAAKNYENLAWLIVHGIHLCTEYNKRYGKIHSCNKTLFEAKKLFHKKTGKAITIHCMVDQFARAMPDDIKNDTTIDDITAYRKYMNTKLWVKDNYVRLPERKPVWISDT